jgi:DNA-directed RNA polymerase subunit RPC12/RpoP
MAQHQHPIELRDEIKDPGSLMLKYLVSCEGCSWKGVAGDLYADKLGKDDMLRCPVCGSAGWTWD